MVTRNEERGKTMEGEQSASHDGGIGNEAHERVEEQEMNSCRRIELLVFLGEDIIGWLFRVEQYFTINRTPEEKKVGEVVICLEGKAINWFQWLDARKPIGSWRDFKQALLNRFHKSQMGAHMRW